MSTGSTGSLLPKWQMAILLGAPIALGLGYLYYRNQTTSKLTEEPDDGNKQKKKLSDSKDKSISIDGDDKLPKDKVEAKKKTPLEEAIAFKNDGNVRFKNGKYNEAIECYNKAIETCPTTHPYDLSTFYQNRAAAYEQLKKWTAVKQDCTSALELNSRYIKALYRRAKAAENMNDLVGSLEDITATCILEGFQNSASLVFADRVLKELGRRDAKEAFSKRDIVYPSKNFIRTYFGSFAKDPITATNVDHTLETGFARASKALKEENYEIIVDACTEEIESPYPEVDYTFEAHLLRGTMYLLIGSLAAAQKDFDFVIDSADALTAVKVNALIKRASLNVQNEQHEKGFQDFSKAEQLDSSNPDIYHQRGQVYVLLEKLDEALADFNTAVELVPHMCSALVQKCYAEYRHALLVQNQVQIYNAIQATHRATERFPENIECFNILAQILSEQQQFDKADELFEKAIKLQPTQASLYVHQGLLHLQWSGDVQKSLDLLNKAIEIDEKCELAYETLGTIQVQRGLLQEAIDLFATALTLCRSELEMVHIYSLRNAAIAQLNVAKKLGLDLSRLGGAGPLA